MTRTFVGGGNVRANDIRQHYLRYGGKGPQLLVVPGITSPAITWEFVAERLGLAYDVWVIDVRGRGLSEAGPDVDYGIAALAADTAAFAEVAGLSDYGLIGHSMGGRIVPAAVVRAGAKPNKVLLADPPMTGPGRRGHDNTDEWFVEQLRKASRGDMTVEEMRPFFPRWTDEALKLRTEWVHTCDPRAIIQTRQDFLEDDFHADIRAIAVPTLVLAAGQGDLITPAEQAELESLNPLVETVRMETAGHMIPWDDYEGFIAQCGRFFGHSV